MMQENISYPGQPGATPPLPCQSPRVERVEHGSDTDAMRREGYLVREDGTEMRDGRMYFKPERQAELIAEAIMSIRNALSRELALPTYPGEKITYIHEIKVSR
jgi:hypothetical protein